MTCSEKQKEYAGKLQLVRMGGKAYKKYAALLLKSLSGRQAIVLSQICRRGSQPIDQPVYRTEWEALVELGLAIRVVHSYKLSHLAATMHGLRVHESWRILKKEWEERNAQS